MNIYTPGILLLMAARICAQPITADPSNYSALVATLQPGDTLLFEPGTYTEPLKLYNLVGTSSAPIVLIGQNNATVFLGNACCNTVSIKTSAFVELHQIRIDGQNIPYIDAIKAEGTAGNWAHHILLDSIQIVGHGGDQQTVGISTKCTTWDWVIRRCRIDGAGTGMYLGNSDGSAPFVNGLIEWNVITNTLGYNVEIKHQNVGSRNSPGMTLNGKTIIRHNVFSKAENASTGGNARPNLLVGNFPATGDGANDLYEIYGNFLWQNPVESLFQGTGNIAFYNNICVNYAGGNGVTFQAHNGFQPRNLSVFHNTIIGDQLWGIRLMDTDPAYPKFVTGNAVFSDHATPIRIVGGGSQSVLLEENSTASMFNALDYITNTANDIAIIDVYPVTATPLQASLISSEPFKDLTDVYRDFNGDQRDWTYRGAYSGQGMNTGWTLGLDQKTINELPVNVLFPSMFQPCMLVPNPAGESVLVKLPITPVPGQSWIRIINLQGQVVLEKAISSIQQWVDVSSCTPGVYLVQVMVQDNLFQSEMVKH